MFSWLLLSPSRLPEMQGGDKKKGGRKRQNAGAQVELKEFIYFISLPHRGDYFSEPAWGGDPWELGPTGAGKDGAAVPLPSTLWWPSPRSSTKLQTLP